MLPKVDNRFEKFDVAIFNDNAIDETYTINHSTEIIIQDFQSPGYRIQIINNNLFFKINKFFYNNGNIEKKGALFNEGAPIGIWYYFDESGRLIKEENTDSGYSFSPEDVVKYCERNKIKLPKGYHETGYQTRVLKKDFEGKKVWEISHLLPSSTEIEEIILDGKDGKVLNKRIVPFINH